MPTTWNVKVRIAPLYGGGATTLSASLVSGDETASIWEAQATFPTGFCAVQARASKP